MDEDEDNNNESSKIPSKAGTFSALETAMEWDEQQSECCPTQLLLLKRIRDLAAKKRRCTMLGKTPKETYTMLIRIYEDPTLSMKYTYEWFNRFQKAGNVFLTIPVEEDWQHPSLKKTLGKCCEHAFENMKKAISTADLVCAKPFNTITRRLIYRYNFCKSLSTIYSLHMIVGRNGHGNLMYQDDWNQATHNGQSLRQKTTVVSVDVAYPTETRAKI
ncbi:uncharacterized protein TNCV_1110591 [Trichonephila clavipes]|nr:uncharacterized protein TNCV_1110591 [Trichonephila clavipes]